MLNEVDSAYTTEIGSSISLYSEPKQKDHHSMVFLFCPLSVARNSVERSERAASALVRRPDLSGVRAQHHRQRNASWNKNIA